MSQKLKGDFSKRRGQEQWWNRILVFYCCKRHELSVTLFCICNPSPPPEPSTHRALCRRWTATWAHLCARAQSISYQCPSGRSPARPSLLMTTRRSPFYLLFFNSKFSIALARPFALTSAAVRTGGPDVLCPHRCALCVKYEQARNEVQTAIMLLSAQWHICIYWERETRGGSEWKKKKKTFFSQRDSLHRHAGRQVDTQAHCDSAFFFIIHFIPDYSVCDVHGRVFCMLVKVPAQQGSHNWLLFWFFIQVSVIQWHSRPVVISLRLFRQRKSIR